MKKRLGMILLVLSVTAAAEGTPISSDAGPGSG